MKVGQLLEMELEEEDGGILEFIGCPRYGTLLWRLTDKKRCIS
jgi:hypothetical protein